MSEQLLHQAACQYLKMQYPDILFNSDLSGIKLTIGQAVKLKSLRSSRAYPDIVIYEPRGSFHGLFIELKVEGTRILKKDDSFASPHIAEQSEMIDKLRKKGYCAHFAFGFDDFKRILGGYMKL